MSAKMMLPKGTTGFFNDANEWVCTGSMMGRRNTVPDNRGAKGKLRMVRLAWVDGDYDQGGAYWGNSRDGSAIYWAKGDLDGEEFSAEIFVRAKSREAAKASVRETLPRVTFYR